MAEYRVNLDIYAGPLDLLLYLIRREEVDIYDIPIARITEQYVNYVQLLKQIDPDLAGEFMVLAATLLEIKTRMLLPQAPPAEGEEQGLEIDPRAELVRQLLEYKVFKDAAGDLRSAAEAQALKFPRQPGQDEAEGEVDLEDVQVWDLLDAFSKVMASISREALGQEVIYDDTPVELHATDILDRLQREGSLTFRAVFEGRTLLSEIIGLFLALLELMRQGKVLASQQANYAEIHLRINPNPPAAQAEGDEAAGKPDETGTYVPEAPPQAPEQSKSDVMGTED